MVHVKLGTGDLSGGRVWIHKGKTQHHRPKGSRKRNQGLGNEMFS